MDPQAFPSSVQNAMNGAPLEEMKGMDLRDYFAAKICAAQLTTTSADRDFVDVTYRRVPGGPSVAEKVAATSYAMADAMLAARVK